jgi:hypothetical protein
MLFSVGLITQECHFFRLFSGEQRDFQMFRELQQFGNINTRRTGLILKNLSL